MDNETARFRWAYIGCGSIANTTAAAIRRSHAVVSVYARNYEKACAFAKRHRAKAYRTFEEAVTAPDVDAVYIATPHTSHTEYAVRAMELGKPVLCEKPVGVSEAQARRLVEAARTHGVYCCEAMWTWFSDVAMQVRGWIRDGRVGDVTRVEMHYAFPGILASRDSRLLSPQTAGGALLDIGVYPITYCYRLFGAPAKITCEGELRGGIDARETVTLHYDGFDCTLHISLTEARESCVIEGSAGRITVPLFHMASFALLTSGGKRTFFRGRTDYRTEFDRVSLEIRAGKTESDYVPFDATVSCLAIMDECRRQMGLVYPFEAS